MSEAICEDLQVLILKRLPVKTLLRCRCVCKSWKEIVASKRLVLDHLATQRPGLLAQNGENKYLLLDTRTLPRCDSLSCPDQFLTRNGNSSFVAVGGVHGVLCLYNNADMLFLWNPSTRQSMRIPMRGPSDEYSDRHRHCGFWMDPSNNDFKVVMFMPWFRGTGSLFSSTKPGAWTELEAHGIPLGCAVFYSSLQVLIGGTGHWLAYTKYDTPDPEKIILCFDFRQDKFGVIKAPRSQSLKSPFIARLCKWQGLLSLVGWSTSRPYHRCDMWAMRSGSWTKMFSFSLIERIQQVHCVLEECGRLLVSNHDASVKQLSYYDSTTLVQLLLVLSLWRA